MGRNLWLFTLRVRIIMADIKLFEIKDKIEEKIASTVFLERELQNLIEENMETFFGVRFLKSEYIITNGRIDSIGIDENNSPVIFEYKRSSSENVINQGLFYLDWLLDHKSDFKLIVLEKLGQDIANQIDWSVPCVIFVANDFTKYDLHAVNQMQRNIKLVKYKKYGDNLLLFEHLNAPVINTSDDKKIENIKQSSNGSRTHLEKLLIIPKHILNIYESLCDYIESLGDDIVANQLKLYLAYKKIKNIVCIEVYNNYVLIYLKLNPDTVELEEGFMRDARNIGYWGKGDLQIKLKNIDDLEKVKPLIQRAYIEG